MYIINKIVGFVVSPVGMAIVGGLAALLCARLKHPCAARRIGWLVVAWLWLCTTPAMTWLVGAPLEREFLVDGRVPAVSTHQRSDAIVVLGGGMGGDTNLSSYAEMSFGADRVWHAARLYAAGKAPRVVATGDNARDTTLPLLRDFGLSEGAVSFLDAKNTEEEAKGIAKMGFRRIVLVTSAWHMKRARLMFDKYAPDVEVVCAPADFEMSVTAGNVYSFKAIVPDVCTLMFNSIAMHEWVGIAGYTLFR